MPMGRRVVVRRALALRGVWCPLRRRMPMVGEEGSDRGVITEPEVLIRIDTGGGVRQPSEDWKESE
jgi:hypothetical protein